MSIAAQVAALGVLTSHGNAMPTSADKFGELRDSTPVGGAPQELWRRLDSDGYVLMRGRLDRDAVLAARHALCELLASAGLVDRRRPVDEAIFSGQSRLEGMDRKAYAQALRTAPAVRALCHGGGVVDFFSGLFGEAVRPFDYIWVRTVRVGGATGCHFDWVYMGRGSRRLHTAWIPLGHVGIEDGPLAVLEGSNHIEELASTYGQLDVDRVTGPNPYDGGWLTRNPNEPQVRYGGRWLTGEFEPGDLLVFGMFTLHCSLDNRSAADRIRLSLDARYQPASEPADERWIGEEPFGHGMR